MAHSSRFHGGSISSTGSLTFSDSSSFSSDGCTTPPPGSPRAGSPASFQWDDSPCSVSSQSSIEEDDVNHPYSEEAALALKRLDLHVPVWGSPPASTSQECGIAIQTASPSPKGKMRKRPSHLKMDLSNMHRFEPPSANTPNTAQMLGAPLIGCLPTPSPTRLHFNTTPRPGLVSRFSDESPAQSPLYMHDAQPFSSPNPSSARASTGLTGLGAPSNSAAPITPRTVDAMDCFGIVPNVSSVLMRRAGSRDKASPLSRSPENGRTLAKSPLGLPSSRPKMTRHASSPLVDARSAQTLYHSLVPGSAPDFEAELAHTPPALNTPFEWCFEADTTPQHQRSSSQPDNPYFMSAFTTA